MVRLKGWRTSHNELPKQLAIFSFGLPNLFTLFDIGILISQCQTERCIVISQLFLPCAIPIYKFSNVFSASCCVL